MDLRILIPLYATKGCTALKAVQPLLCSVVSAVIYLLSVSDLRLHVAVLGIKLLAVDIESAGSRVGSDIHALALILCTEGIICAAEVGIDMRCITFSFFILNSSSFQHCGIFTFFASDRVNAL